MKTIKFLVLTVVAIILFCTTKTLAQENAKEGDAFYIVDEMPEYPGGIDALKSFISNSVKYPEAAKKAKKTGKVYVSFVVNKDGTVVNAKIEKGVCSSLDKEALRVINALPAWKPGQHQGEKVNVKYTIPIMFALDGEHKNSTNASDDQVFKIVENMPEFPGGNSALRKYISQKIKYPEKASKEGIEGKVYVTFVVGKDGKIKKSRIVRSSHPLLDAEALRVINTLPAWKPGQQRGEKVNVEYTMPIMFSLDDKK